MTVLPTPFTGQSIKRLEDPRLLRGEAAFIEDVRLVGMLHVAFVRSIHAHSRFRVDASAALAAPGASGPRLPRRHRRALIAARASPRPSSPWGERRVIWRGSCGWIPPSSDARTSSAPRSSCGRSEPRRRRCRWSTMRGASAPRSTGRSSSRGTTSGAASRPSSPRRARAGRLLGIGMAAYVALTGLGPYEGAILRVDATGRVELIIGALPHGQGTTTALAQVVADALALEPRDVSVGYGDTALIPFGVGTDASRNAVTASHAALGAARAVVAKARRLAAHLLEVGEADLELADGGPHVVGAPDRRLSLAELARAYARRVRPCRRGWSPASRRRTTSRRRSPRSPTACTSRSSSWTGRPGVSRSSTTWS